MQIAIAKVLSLTIVCAAGCGGVEPSEGSPFELEDAAPGCSATASVAYFNHMRGPEYIGVLDNTDILYNLPELPELITAIDTNEDEAACLAIDVVSLTPTTCIVIDVEPDEVQPVPSGPVPTGHGIDWVHAGTCELQVTVRGSDGSEIVETARFGYAGADFAGPIRCRGVE